MSFSKVDTRKAKQDAFASMVETLLDVLPEEAIPKALEYEAIKSYPDLTGLSDAEISSFKYSDGVKTEGKTTKDQIRALRMHEANLLILLKRFLKIKQQEMYPSGSTLSITDQTNFKQSEFDEFRTGPLAFVSYDSTTPPAVKNPSTTTKTAVSDVEQFKKGIKRDMNSYPVLKDNKFFDRFELEFTTIAKAHDVIEVFTPTYVPKNIDEKALFDEKQKFGMSVLVTCIKTDVGLSFVREHQKDGDAQKCWKKIYDEARTSTRAELDLADLEDRLIQTKIDNSWRGTVTGFLIYWKELVRKQEELAPSGQKYAAPIRKRLLKAAVNGHPKLSAVFQMDLDQISRGMGAMTFQQYYDLLISVATQVDHETTSTRKPPSKRVVNYLDLTPEEYEDLKRDDEQPNVSNYSAFATNVTDPESTYVSNELWLQLPIKIQKYIQEARERDGISRRPKERVAKMTERDPVVIETPNSDASSALTQPTIVSKPPDLNNDVRDLLTNMSQADIRSVLSTSRAERTREIKEAHTSRHDIEPQKHTIVVDGVTYTANMTKMSYRVTKHERSNDDFALVDRGANGGMAGADVRVIEECIGKKANVSGIDDHEVKDLPICTVGATVMTNKGPVILVMHQYAYLGKGKTIHSSGQMEMYRTLVDDRSKQVGGTQRVATIDGYVIPLCIKNGLPYMKMRPYTDQEFIDLPTVIVTSDLEWDPSCLDSEFDLEDDWQDAQTDTPDGIPPYDDNRFSSKGEYLKREVTFLDAYSSEDKIVDLDDSIDSILREVQYRKVAKGEPDYEAVRPCFAWAPIDVIKKTFECTTQYARNSYRMPFRRHFKSRNPAVNVARRNEPVATDTVFSDTPAVDDGSTAAQIFVGRKTLVTDVYGMKTTKEFVNTLEDNVRERGAMSQLISDRAQVEISGRVHDFLRTLFIRDWQSEPYNQQQNFAENRWGTAKMYVNNVLNRTGAPAFTWLLCLIWVVCILNHLATESLNWRSPLEALTGVTPDISPLLCFFFWEPVYFDKYEEGSFPSKSTETLGRFVGVSQNVGEAMTFVVLDPKTMKKYYRSAVRSALKPEERNRRLEGLDEFDPSVPQVLRSRSQAEGEAGLKLPDAPSISHEDFVGQTFLLPPNESGERLRARIVRKIIEHDEDCQKILTKFLVSTGEGRLDEIFSYNDVIDYLNQQAMEEESGEQFFRFKDIVGHEGPLKASDPGYLGSKWNVMIAWEDGTQTNEPLTTIAKDSPVICARYAKDHNLLDEPGWKQFKRLANRDKKMVRMINQARLVSIRRSVQYQYGYQVPRTPEEGLNLDKKNGNTQWKDAMALEIEQLQEYQTFRDLGSGVPGPVGYKKIRCHFVFAVKHDGRHKARLVAGGHLTDVPLESVYSGVVSLRSLRLVIFLAELNDLKIYGADIGNAYLEAKTKEKVYIIADKGFGPLEGHILVIDRALYGLRTSGLRWHEKFADTLRDMGFVPSKADPDVWMREAKKPSGESVYEYIAVYVDDLCIAAIDPDEILGQLKGKYKYKLKGDGPIEFHLGCNFVRDPDGTLSMGPTKYIEKLGVTYKQMYGEDPKPASSPLVKNDHPEIDETPLLDPDDIVRYQSMIGALQWVVTLGRFDVCTPVMTMSRFRVAPRVGHIDRLKRIYGYLLKYPNGAIRVRTNEPDYSDLEDVEYDWAYTVYGNVKEVELFGAPKPLGRAVVTTTYVDANLYHDLITGRAVTGVLHLVNGTAIDWYSKRQATVETATYGSEFVAARIATDQILDLRMTLRYLGVPIKTKSYMFGDNKSVVTSATIPHSGLNKRHNALSYHRVREAIASKVLSFFHIGGTTNPADILSKHGAWVTMWPLLKPLLFWRGDTSIIGDGVATKIPKAPKVKLE